MAILYLSELISSRTQRYNELFLELSDDYTMFVDSLSVKRDGDEYWWTTHFASRCALLSYSLKEISQLFLLFEVLDENKAIDAIVVDKWTIGRVIQRYLEKNGNQKIRVISPVHKTDYLKVFRFLKCVMLFCRERRTIQKRIIRNQKNRRGKINCSLDHSVLIQTDVFSSNFQTGKFVARDFYNIEEYINIPLVYYPYLYINSDMDMKQLVDTCFSDNTRFIFREEYLKLCDYSALFCILWKYHKYRVKDVLFRGIDITEIINDDIAQSAFSTNTYYGIMDYRALKRMKMCGIEMQSLVGWYEGQPSSLGFFMGARKFYPEIDCVGYTGYPIDKTWIQLSPSCEEIRQRIVPKRITVIGDYYARIVKKYCSNYDSCVAPAFRLNSYYSQDKVDRSDSSNHILVVLPYDRSSCVYCLEMLSHIRIPQGYDIMIRNHPVHKGTTPNEYGVSFDEIEYNIVDEGPLIEVARQCGPVIMPAMSTSGLELILSGKLLIYIMTKGEINMTGTPSEWKDIFYYEVYECEQLQNTVDWCTSSVHDTQVPNDRNIYLENDASLIHNLL